jgi:transcriptional regulator with XRE-family HTH domain
MQETRRQRRITIRELGKATGISAARISDIELGRAVPTSEEFDSIVRELGSNIKFPETDPVKAKAKMDEMLKTIKAIGVVTMEARKKCPEGGRGYMDCPVCGEELGYSVASFNKHVWGKCSTSGCLEWMQ